MSHSGRYTPKGTPSPARPRRVNPIRRRQWLDRVARADRLSAGCRAWLLLLAHRSNDAGKPVWGSQIKMGTNMGRCERSIRYYRAQAEAAGYITVDRADPVRDRRTGRVYRPRSNVYLLTFPARATATPAELVDVPSEAVVVPALAWSHRPAKSCRSTPLSGVTNPHPVRAGGAGGSAIPENDNVPPDGAPPSEQSPPIDRETLHRLLAETRELLANSQPLRPNRKTDKRK